MGELAFTKQEPVVPLKLQVTASVTTSASHVRITRVIGSHEVFYADLYKGGTIDLPPGTYVMQVMGACKDEWVAYELEDGSSGPDTISTTAGCVTIDGGAPIPAWLEPKKGADGSLYFEAYHLKTWEKIPKFTIYSGCC